MRACILGCSALLLSGCDFGKIARLEKENQELKAQADKKKTSEEYDLQAKCSKDAKAWFKESWGNGDKDTILLHYTNHYHKASNKCLILVEYHYNSYPGNGSWVNDMTLWDVYENSQIGNFGESHAVRLKPDYHVEDHVSTCEVFDRNANLSKGSAIWPDHI